MASAVSERIGPYPSLRRLTQLAALLFAMVAALALAGPAYAVCQLIADAPYRSPAPGEARVWHAALGAGEVQIRYIGHSTFELETPQGVRIATDYNDSIRPFLPPTVATMNGAHSTHYAVSPDPGIEHLLYGWNPQGGPIDHDLTVQDVRIRNIQTNIRGWDGESRRLGNSIFIFEVADLCIAHLGHLHHRLTREDLTRLGQIDIVFAAIDNSSTLRLESLMHVLESIGPAMVIPMHFHFSGALQSFVGRATEAGYEIIQADTPKLIVTRAGLPMRKTVYIMMPGGA
ncbi:MBL fold metallo-hydrolase [Roseibium marinum]|uniref:L-ascorbate metabolism protein UlaG (Beta-lactamase superfamily) n=1 Tax=Roseibium marinum TaxID=281252 RepID=A0A2S3V402_9HYPH|nr:MBL fold metallo-hydrolase [Roseibium marinum]POF34691.1 L-ascorbate metabolism protein UlaG (beta-lactamase superfamily) [Roseibium marinum]